MTRSTEKTNRREAEAVLTKWLAAENGDTGAEGSFRIALTSIRRLENQAADNPARLDEVRHLRRRWTAEILHDATEPLALDSVWDTWHHSPAKQTPGPATLSGYGSI